MTHRLDIVSAVMCAAIRSFLVLRIFSSGALGIKKRGGYIAVSFFIGVFRRGNKPSVLPREEKRAERQKSMASLVRAERLLKKKNLL